MAVLRLGEHFQVEEAYFQISYMREFSATQPIAGDLTLTVERLAPNTPGNSGRTNNVPFMVARGSFCGGPARVGLRVRLMHRDQGFQGI